MSPALLGRLGEERGLDLDAREREVVECRDPSWVGGPGTHAEVADEGDGPVPPADDDGLVAAAVAAGAAHLDARDELLVAIGRPGSGPRLREAQLGLFVGGHEPRVGAECDVPLVGLGDDAGAGEGRAAGEGQQASGVVEVEV